MSTVQQNQLWVMPSQLLLHKDSNIYSGVLEVKFWNSSTGSWHLNQNAECIQIGYNANEVDASFTYESISF